MKKSRYFFGTAEFAAPIILYSLDTFLALLLSENPFLLQRKENRFFHLVFQVLAYSNLLRLFGKYDFRFHDYHPKNPMLAQIFLCGHHSLHEK